MKKSLTLSLGITAAAATALILQNREQTPSPDKPVANSISEETYFQEAVQQNPSSEEGFKALRRVVETRSNNEQIRAAYQQLLDEAHENQISWDIGSISYLRKKLPNNTKAARILARSLNVTEFRSLTLPQRERLVEYANSLSFLEEKQSVPPLCWHSSTPQNFVTASEKVRAYSLAAAGSEANVPLAALQIGDRWATSSITTTPTIMGQGITLTWGIVPDGTIVRLDPNDPGEPSNLIEIMNATFGSNGGINEQNQPWFQFFIDGYDYWEDVCGIDFVYESEDDGVIDGMPNPDATSGFGGAPGLVGVRPDLRIGGRNIDGDGQTLALNFFPAAGGDMVIDTADGSVMDNSVNGRLQFINMVTHEVGHGIGHQHVCPINETKLMEPFATTQLEGVQFDEILTAQANYGDRLEINTTVGNSLFRNQEFNPGTAEDKWMNDEFPTFIGELNSTSDYISPQVAISVAFELPDGTRATEVDRYTFRVADPSHATITVTPTTRAPYLEGPQLPNGDCSPGSPFDPQLRQDLTMMVVDPDSGRVLALETDQELGFEEIALNVPFLETGKDYELIVWGDGRNEGTANPAQLYGFSIDLYDAPPVFFTTTQFTFESGSCGAIGNNVPDPVETVNYSIRVYNDGINTANNIVFTVAAAENVTFIGDTTFNIASIASGEFATVNFTAIIDADCGDEATFNFTTTSDELTEVIASSETFRLGLPNPPTINDSFEGFDNVPGAQPIGGWISSSDDPLSNFFINSDEAFVGNQSVFANTISTMTSTYLTTPSLEVPAGPSTIDFWHQFIMEYTFDGGVLEISLDDGETWQEWIEAGGSFIRGGYTTDDNGGEVKLGWPYWNPLRGQWAWTGNSIGFINTTALFPEAAGGKTCRIRFHLGQDLTRTDIGWWIDEVRISLGYVCCESVIPQASIAAAPAATVEGGLGGFNITTDQMAERDIQIAYTVAGTATPGADYTALAGSLNLPQGSQMTSFDVEAISDALAEDPETVIVSLANSGLYTIDTANAVATVTINDAALPLWQAIHFGENTTNTGNNDDFDGDGVANIVEYALGTDPTKASTQPTASIEENGDKTELVLEYEQDVNRTDVSYIAEASASMAPGSWSTTPVTLTYGPTVNGKRTVKAAVDTTTEKNCFIRVRVEQN